jgi:hypothetical protein
MWMKMITKKWWSDTDRREVETLGVKLFPLPLCPPQIPHGLSWDRTRALAVTGRMLTA